MAKAKEDLNGDGRVTMQEKVLAALASYGRHFLGAAIALYMTGNTSPRDLLLGGFAATAPVILKALNPNEASFGFTKK
jgi:ATP-dependent protease HslVU (ClpYQ) peptidase subunit